MAIDILKESQRSRTWEKGKLAELHIFAPRQATTLHRTCGWWRSPNRVNLHCGDSTSVTYEKKQRYEFDQISLI